MPTIDAPRSPTPKRCTSGPSSPTEEATSGSALPVVAMATIPLEKTTDASPDKMKKKKEEPSGADEGRGGTSTAPAADDDIMADDAFVTS